MTTYFAGAASLTDTPSKIVDSAPIDRKILLRETSGDSQLGFSEGAVEYRPLGAANAATHEFVIPADHELWGRAEGTSSGIRFLVTSIGR